MHQVRVDSEDGSRRGWVTPGDAVSAPALHEAVRQSSAAADRERTQTEAPAPSSELDLVVEESVTFELPPRRHRPYRLPWAQRAFPWFFDLLITIVPDPPRSGVAGRPHRVEALLGRVMEPLDGTLSAIGRGLGVAWGPIGGAVARAFEPLDSLVSWLGRVLGAVWRAGAGWAGRLFDAVPLPVGIRGWLGVGSSGPALAESEAMQTRVKSRYDSMLWMGVIASVLLHAALFQFWPTLRADDFSFTPSELTSIELPPEIEIPPPPRQIARPATPVIAAASVDEDLTIAPTTFEDNPVEDLPPPPTVDVVEAARVENEPFFTPYTVAPSLRNVEAVSRAMLEEYPPLLRDSGVGGVVVLWFSIDESGRVLDTRVSQSSGFDQLDEAALRVADRIEFTPALDGDRRVAVWVQFPLEFRVR